MKWCRLSTMLDVFTRRIDRQNAQIDAHAASGQALSAELRGWRLQMDAENAASRARVAALMSTPPSFEALDAWIAQFDEDRRQRPSGVTQTTA